MTSMSSDKTYIVFCNVSQRVLATVSRGLWRELLQAAEQASWNCILPSWWLGHLQYFFTYVYTCTYVEQDKKLKKRIEWQYILSYIYFFLSLSTETQIILKLATLCDMVIQSFQIISEILWNVPTARSILVTHPEPQDSSKIPVNK